jgi:type II secretory pathway pseudopilin PulG
MQDRLPVRRRRASLRADERGYLMVALLVAMSIMAIFMGAALPAWRTLAQREKEAELIFRGEQYARAIGLFQRRYANATPPNLDVLVNERFLRKKYKDPITNGDFQLISPGAALPGAPQQPGTQQGPQPPSTTNPSAGRGRGIDLSPSGGRQGQTGPGQPGSGGGAGGVVGVVSKSTERAFRLYNGRDSYNQWVFMAIQQSTRAGGPGGGAGGIGPGAGGTGPRGTGPRGSGPRGGAQPPTVQPPRGGFPPPAGGGRGGPAQNPGRGGSGRGF